MKNELAKVVTCIFDRTIIYLESPHVRLFLIDVPNLYKRFFHTLLDGVFRARWR